MLWGYFAGGSVIGHDLGTRITIINSNIVFYFFSQRRLCEATLPANRAFVQNYASLKRF